MHVLFRMRPDPDMHSSYATAAAAAAMTTSTPEITIPLLRFPSLLITSGLEIAIYSKPMLHKVVVYIHLLSPCQTLREPQESSREP